MPVGELLTTPRLWLVPLAGDLVARRLTEEAFTATLLTGEGPRAVRFDAEWPGDLLPLFRLWRDHDVVDTGTWTMVTREEPRAIGALGRKGPAADGVEIGYGVNASWGGRGYATEAVRALVGHLSREHPVVTAETEPANVASARVLQKAGFRRSGERREESGVRSLEWRWTPRTSPPAPDPAREDPSPRSDPSPAGRRFRPHHRAGADEASSGDGQCA